MARQDDPMNPDGDVKKTTAVVDFVDYLRLLRPAVRGIILVSLLNCTRVSETGMSLVKVIGLTSEKRACNPLVCYLCWAVYLCSLCLLCRDDKLPVFNGHMNLKTTKKKF